MNLTNLPPDVTDWSMVPVTVHAGETGNATARARQMGDVQVRLVDYGPGYVADHWCAKGHILFVVAGALQIEHRDGPCFALSAGMSWHAGDGEGPPHRVVCREGARVFIVD
jgi:hypothetical protein